MTTQVPIDIVIDSSKATKGGKEVEKALEGVGKQLDGVGDKLKDSDKQLSKNGRNFDLFAGISRTAIGKTARAVDVYRRALHLLVAGLGVREFIKAVDVYTAVSNRMNLITTNVDEAANAMSRLRVIALQTRTSFEGTADLFTSVALSVKHLGVESNQSLNFVKGVNQAIVLSGASSIAAKNGLIQFAQGIASGALRGDELRSVLEQLPFLADIIAKKFSQVRGKLITRGDLRDLGALGEIKTPLILQAVLENREELERLMSITIPTLAQSFTILKDRIAQFTVDASETIGTIKALNSAMTLLTNNFIPLALSLISVLGLFASLLIYKKLMATSVLALVGMFGGFGIAVKASLLSLKLYQAGLLTFSASLGVIVFRVKALMASLWLSLMKSPVGLKLAVLTGVVFALYKLIDVLFLADKANKKFRESLSKIGDEAEDTERKMAALVQSMSRSSLIKEYDKIFKEIEDLKDRKEELNKLVDGNNFKSRPEGYAILKKQLAEVSAEMEMTEKQADDLFNMIINFEELNKLSLLEKPKEDFEAMRKELELMEKILSRATGNLKEYSENFRMIDKLEKEGSISPDMANELKAQDTLSFLQDQTPMDFSEGYLNQLDIMVLETRNAGAELGKTFGEIFGPGGTLSKSLGDSMAEVLIYGANFRETMRDMARSILATIVSAIIQIGVNMLINFALGQTLQKVMMKSQIAMAKTLEEAWRPAAVLASLATGGTNSIGAVAGMAFAGAASTELPGLSSGSLPGFASGGYTGNGSTSDISGYVHNKEFVVNAQATKKNRGLLESMNSGRSSGLNVNIINQIPNAEYDIGMSQSGEMEIIARRVVDERSPKVIASEMSNPNSLVSKSFNNNYDASRKR